MRQISEDTALAWLAPDKTGPRAPMVRATIQKLWIKTVPYDAAKIPTVRVNLDAEGHLNGIRYVTKQKGTGVFATSVFGQAHTPIELPNVRSIRWERSIDNDAATCTLTLFNTALLPLGTAPEDPNWFQGTGYYTPNRGVGEDAIDRWGNLKNRWQGILAPDRLIRTYEGYGCDPTLSPENDPHMYPSGVWLIDDVEFTSDGMITVQCRDLARLLIEQIHFPPVIPSYRYPPSWERFHSVDNPDIQTTTTGWFHPTYDDNDNEYYVGKGFTDGNMPYVDSKGGVLGHYGAHAFDAKKGTYWLSVGNMPYWTSAYPFVQGKFSKRTIGAVKVHVWGGPYVAYVSVFADGKWQGKHRIPYKHRVVDVHADKMFVAQTRIGKGETKIIKLPKQYANATKIRITLTHLYNSGIGYYKWRGGIYDVQASTNVKGTKDGGTHVEGDYWDFTEIIKWLLAWGGFYWPNTASGLNYVKKSDGAKAFYDPVPLNDQVLGTGRVWGDFEPTGTGGIVGLGDEIWSKQPLMDGINYIRDIVSFVFFIDETGGAVWRSPNIWQVGNWISQSDGGVNAGRTSNIVSIDERVTLLDYRAKLTGRNLREKNFVCNTSGVVGALSPTKDQSTWYNPNRAGMRRVLIYTDQNFANTEECQVMADLIMVRQMFTYRSGTVVVAGNPAIQIDDQVRIWERTTGESYLHYVRGISCELDITNGRYAYTLDTHWLGTQPFTDWVVDPSSLSAETQYYLRALGKI